MTTRRVLLVPLVILSVVAGGLSLPPSGAGAQDKADYQIGPEDVLDQAGAFTEFASRGRIFILRPNGTTMKRIPFSYNKVIAADGEHGNFFLQPGDIIVVP